MLQSADIVEAGLAAFAFSRLGMPVTVTVNTKQDQSVKESCSN